MTFYVIHGERFMRMFIDKSISVRSRCDSKCGHNPDSVISIQQVQTTCLFDTIKISIS